MTALTMDRPRAFELQEVNELPIVSGARIYEGAAVGIEAQTGLARAFGTKD